jgi:hypothetical protein
MTAESSPSLRRAGAGLLLLLACGDAGGSSMAEGVGDSSGGEPPAITSTSMFPTSDGSSGGASATEGGTTTSTTGPDPSTTTGETTMGVDDTGTSTDGTTSTGPDGTTSTGPDDTSTGTTDETSTTGDVDACALAQQHLPCDAMSDDPLHAIGLNCTSLGPDWVDQANATAVANLDFQAPPPAMGKRAWQVAKTYGTYVDPNTNAPFWSAREGEKLLMISSGLLPPPNGQGVIVIADGDVYNDTAFGGVWDSDVMPPPMSPELGSPDPMGFTDCDGVGDCSNTLKDQWELGFGSPEDKMWFSFELTAPAIVDGAPADANGYRFDFAFFSAEFPEYVDMSVNDMFVVWQDSEAYTGNVTFINGQPMTVTALWPVDFPGQCDIFMDPDCVNPMDPHLAGTGHIADGGATNWYQAQGGVSPGETFVLSFAIFDMADSTFDTTALIDDWQWECEGCVPNEVDDCEIQPQ